MNNGQTALLYACTKNSLDVVELLITSGANIELKNNDGDNPLLTSFKCSRYEVTDLLINKGADINQQDKLGNTILIYACQDENKLDILHFISKGGDLLIKNNDGQSAFYILKETKGNDVELMAFIEKIILEKSLTDEQGCYLGL